MKLSEERIRCPRCGARVSRGVWPPATPPFDKVMGEMLLDAREGRVATGPGRDGRDLREATVYLPHRCRDAPNRGDLQQIRQALDHIEQRLRLFDRESSHPELEESVRDLVKAVRVLANLVEGPSPGGIQ